MNDLFRSSRSHLFMSLIRNGEMSVFLQVKMRTNLAVGLLVPLWYHWCYQHS